MTRQAIVRCAALAMTVKAPPHRQIPHARDVLHPRHVAVALTACDARAEMRLVAEVDEAGKDVHALPGNRLAGFPVAAHLRDLRVVGIDEPVTSYAAFDRRDPRKRRPSRRGVTELAAQLVVAGVNGMAEIDRLAGCVRFRCGGPARGDEQQHERSKGKPRPHRHVKVRVVFILLILGGPSAFAQGGPPLITDDPDTPGPGFWEVNISVQSDSSRNDTRLETPRVDANYGVGDRIQLKFELPWVQALDGERRQGPGDATAGVKWRFLGREGMRLAWSVYPQVEFNTARSSVNKELVDAGLDIQLPTEITLEIAHVEINGEQEAGSWVSRRKLRSDRGSNCSRKCTRRRRGGSPRNGSPTSGHGRG